MTDSQKDLEQRVHVDRPRVRPEEMVVSVETTLPPDPTGGKDDDTEFMIRHFG